MLEKIQQRPVTLAEFRKVLDRRKHVSLDIARRATTPRMGKASHDEAAFYAGLRALLDELELARIELSGNQRPPIDAAAEINPAPIPHDSHPLKLAC